MDFLSLVGLGAAAFLGSNIDDLFILMIFFTYVKFPKSQVVLGQYAGMGALLAVAALASLVSLIIPSNWLGLLGLFPIAIGIKEILELKDEREKENQVSSKTTRSKWLSYLPFLTVAAVTFSGGEEIGIYASVFATNNALDEIITVVLVSMILTGVWSAIAYYLVSRPTIAVRTRQFGKFVLPLILFALGGYILAEVFINI